MKRVLSFMLALLLCLALAGCAKAAGDALKPTTANEEEEIRQLVEAFGSKLQNVSLLAPKELLSKSLYESYGDYVSQALLEKWQKDPQDAPGRAASSPWPDRIELLNVEKQSDGTYKVSGEVIEVTSVEKVKGGYAVKRPIELTVKKVDSRWLIDDVVLGKYQE